MKRLMIWTAVWALVLGSGSWAAGPTEVTLKSPCCDFALNPSTGDLVGIDPTAGTATLYPKAYLEGQGDKVVGPVAVGKVPVSVIYKRYKGKSYFAVVGQGDGHMHVLDPTSLKPVKRVVLAGNEASSLSAARDEDDPYIYYAYGRGHESSAGRMSLKTFLDEGKIALGDSVMDLAVSADGRYLYTRGPWSPSGFDAYERTGEATTGKDGWRKVCDEHRSTARYVPGAFTRYTAAGTGLFSADLNRKVAVLGFTPLCFFPDRPVIVGVGANQLVAASHNTFKVFGRLNLTGVFKTRDRWGRRGEGPGWRMPAIPDRHADFKNFGYRRRILADPANDRVVVGFGDRALLVPLKALAVGDEPLLVAEIPAPRAAFVGQAVRVPCKPLDKRCKLALKAGPEGMKLSGGALVWTPRASQVGPARFTLRMYHGQVERTETFRLNVAQPYLRLGFAPDGLEISPTGKLAVAWTAGRRDARGGRDEQSRRSWVALIDVAAGKVLVGKELLYQITAAAVDAHFVYVAPSQAERINALGLKLLARRKLSMTDGRVRWLVPVASKMLVAGTARGMLTFSVPELKAAPTVLHRKGPLSEAEEYRLRMIRRRFGGRESEEPGLRRLGRDWYGAGCVVGADLRTVRTPVTFEGLPMLPVQRSRPLQEPVAWNRMVSPEGLMTASGKRIAQLERDTTILLPDHPVAVSAGTSPGEEGHFSARLTLRDLVTGEVRRRIALLEQVRRDDDESEYLRRRYNGDSALLASVGKTVVAAVGDRLFAQTLQDEVLAKFTRPFELQRLAKVVVLSTAGPTELKHAPRGGSQPFEFELTTSHKAMKIDPKTGTVTIDGPAMLKEAAAAIRKEQQEETARRIAEGQKPSAESLTSERLRAAAGPARHILGREPRGLPMLVPVGVVATDGKQQMAALDYQAVLEVPRALVRQTLAALVKDLTRDERPAGSGRVGPIPRLPVLPRPRTRPSAPPTAERINRLERRIEALEAKLDLIIRLVRDRKTPKK